MYKFIAEWLQMLSAALFIAAIFEQGPAWLGVTSAFVLKVLAVFLYRKEDK